MRECRNSSSSNVLIGQRDAARSWVLVWWLVNLLRRQKRLLHATPGFILKRRVFLSHVEGNKKVDRLLPLSLILSFVSVHARSGTIGEGGSMFKTKLLFSEMT